MKQKTSLGILAALLVTLSTCLTVSQHNLTTHNYSNKYLASVHAPKYKSKLFIQLDNKEDRANYLAWKSHILDASEDVKNTSGNGADGKEDRSFAMKWHEKFVDAAEDWNNQKGGFDGIEDTLANRYWSDFKGDGKGRLVNQALKAAEAVPSRLA
jgi:hypothetical protein